MTRIVLRAPSTFEAGFARIRSEHDVPLAFPGPVLAEAEQAAPATGPDDRLDARHLDFVAIDPPGATDLDQAYTAERTGSGYRVRYAIADVGDFIVPGHTLDTESRERGTTLYSPDTRTPLHPPVLSENRASLLAGTDKPALLWTIELDADGSPADWRLERALVRVREAMSYAEAQSRIDADPPGDDKLTLLAEIGRLRQQREADRGGVSISLPAQEVVEHNGSYSLEFDLALPVENWNAQISLLTGIVAGRTMVDAAVGVLRTLPPPYDRAVARLRRTAKALGLDWPAELPYAAFVRDLTPNSPACNAFLLQATRTLRGAGYVGFHGTVPEHAEHGAIASVYSHVTAPLRRLVDRFGNAILLALFAGDEPPAWAIEALDELPSLMGKARQRESALERSMVDFAEALVLERSVGQTFSGHVVDLDTKRGLATIQITAPAIVATVDGAGRTLAEQLELRLDAVDVDDRTIAFTPLG
ncbi:MAG: RNB domain-containing ribonuclease [Acidimicrobiia bacterium]|nr:RNB domain-containing ribonuclease [Acidimicrobiia bacterium]